MAPAERQQLRSMSRLSPPYRTNRDLFSNHYLTERLRRTESWQDVDRSEVREIYEGIRQCWEETKHRVEDYDEAQLDRHFVRPILELLGIPVETEETGTGNVRRPDYGFFPSEEAAETAFDRDDVYDEAIAVADVRRWGRRLDARGEERRDYENPSYRIHATLREIPVQWGVLTNGKQWRLYYGPTSHRLDSYYEIDLPELLEYVEEDGGMEDFEEFYRFFRREAFLPDQSGACFLDGVYDESIVCAEKLGEDLRDNVYEAVRVLAEGFLDANDELGEDDLSSIHDSSLVYLYRLVVVLYAESEGRGLLPTENDVYGERYSLNDLKREVAANETRKQYQTGQTKLWDRLEELFTLVDRGSRGMDVPDDQLYVPAYSGSLFRTSPEPGDSEEAQFLATHEVDDAHLAAVVDLLTRRDADEGDGRVFVDYSSLDERHLGSMYESLLEYELDVAHEPLAVEDGEYVPAEDGDELAAAEGDVYLRTDGGERKVTGSYYTPEHVVEYIVDETLGPLVEEIRADLSTDATTTPRREGYTEEFANRIFELRVLDPAMGSGHFLVSAVDYLAREIIDARERRNRRAIESGTEEALSDPRTEGGELRDVGWARREVAQRCLYGVDLNPLATELAKASLWLRTLAGERPPSFLDHHLKTGNSVVGSDVVDVFGDGETDGGDGQETRRESVVHTREKALERVMDRFQDLRSIDDEPSEDAEGMEEIYEEVREDAVYRRLLATANVHTAEAFGLNVPVDAYERMTEALRDESWRDIEQQSWFQSARTMAREEKFFHWELEFPAAFYADDGERREDAGFDAVVGNPPWVATAGRANISANMDRTVRSYLESEFTATREQFDSYVAFYEQFVRLSRTDRTGIVVPDAILTREQNAHLRKFLLESASVEQIITAGVAFEGVENGTAVLITGESGEIVQCADASEKSDLDELKFDRIPVAVFENEDEYRFLTHLDGATRDIVAKIEAQPPISDRIEISRGEEMSKRSEILERSARDGYREIVPGGGIVRYGFNRDESRYIPDERIEKDLANYGSPKLLFRQTSDSLVGTFDDSSRITIKSAYNVHAPEMTERETKWLLGILNSTLLDYYHDRKHAAYRSVFPQINQSTVESLPVPPVDRVAELSELVDQRLRATSNRARLALSPLEYLGNVREGPDLPDVGRIRPTGPTVLDATTAEYEKLRIGDVATERDGDAVTVYATARYKPENEDEFEIDRWGYTETEYVEAFTLGALSETEAVLTEAFVPVAVDDELAGFRDNATRNKALVDRLKAITLPDPDDVADGLERYVEAKSRAEALGEKIERTDRLVDEIVYDLYDLTDDEIELVERAVNDDGSRER